MINFFYGKHRLKMFRIRLKGYILGLDDGRGISFGSAEESEFGKWLETAMHDLMSSSSLIKDQLKRSHETIHQVAQKIVDYINLGDYSNAREEFIKVDEEHNRILELLNDIEKDYNQS